MLRGDEGQTGQESYRESTPSGQWEPPNFGTRKYCVPIDEYPEAYLGRSDPSLHGTHLRCVQPRSLTKG